MELDYKQKQLIDGWITQSRNTDDPYFSFMSLWVAFNAACYAAFHPKAIKQRANLKVYDCTSRNIGLDVHITLSEDSSRTSRIEIDTDPLKLKLTISKKYTENEIFDAFVSSLRRQYQTSLESDIDFSRAVDTLQRALMKNNGCYVLNLSHKDAGDVDSWPPEQIKRETERLSSFHQKTSLGQLKNVLYQVRSNIFHGEKVPGNANDRRIVSAAYPVLCHLMHLLLQTCNWSAHTSTCANHERHT